MAVLLMTGVAGTGKTLYAIQKYIIPELKRGGVVYSNIDGLDVNRLAIFYDMDVFIVEKNYRKITDVKYFYKEAEINSLIVLDEVQNIFNNREWQEQANNDCIKYCMEHRHYGHQVIFITPAIDSVDAGIRRVVQFTYKHKSFSAIGLLKNVKCAIFDQCNIQREPLQVFNWKHDEKIYSCYKSYFNDGTKEKKPKIQPVPKMLIFMIFLVFAIMIYIFRNPPTWIYKKKPKQTIQSVVSVEKKENYIKKRIMINDSLYGGQR